MANIWRNPQSESSVSEADSSFGKLNLTHKSKKNKKEAKTPVVRVEQGPCEP